MNKEVGMKKLLYIILLGAMASACTKNVVITDPYSPGVCVGEIILGATEGTVSVSVETEGAWRIESDQDWLRTDVNGRSGNGAFTVYYSSNVSDMQSLKQARTAKIAIFLEKTMTVDTLVLVQRGMHHVEPSHEITADPALKLEYAAKVEKEATLLCLSSEGTADVAAVIAGQAADVVVLDGVVTGELEGFNIVGCNHDGLSQDEEYEAFRKVIEQTYNSGPYAGDKWIYAGQMYHLSSMQIGYESTPEWYPQTTKDGAFRSDIYAWQNNLYDCVWMYAQDYVETYTDGQSRSYSADYVYVSASVFALLTSVELLDVEGLSHKPVKLTLKY